jgi:transcription-repair coupling factor (superfamily II helicase)
MWNPLRARVGAAFRPGATFGGLPGGAAAAAIDPSLLPLVVLVPTAAEQDRVERELRFHLGARAVYGFPADDVRPYDGFSPHPDIPRARLQALDALVRGEPVAVVASAAAALHRVLPPEMVKALHRELRPDMTLDRDALRASLVAWGYVLAPVVEDRGTISVRGDVVDVWPVGSDDPVRIELFDDLVERIHAFDPTTQRKKQALEVLRLLPAREALPTEEALRRAPSILAEVVDETGVGHATRRRVLEELKEGIWFPGAEDYLPALHELRPLWDYAPTLVVIDEAQVQEEARAFSEIVRARWESADPNERPPVVPQRRYVTPEELDERLPTAVRIESLALDTAIDLHARDNADLRVGTGEIEPVLARIRGWLDDAWQVAIVVETKASGERVKALFAPHGLTPHTVDAGTWRDGGELVLWHGDLPRGFRSPEDRLALIAADEIFGAKAKPLPVPRTLKDAVLTSVTDVKVGDLVVHALHGIGRFEGLRRLPVQADVNARLDWGFAGASERPAEQDFALLIYRDDDRLYLPVTRFDQLYRYRTVGDVTPRLDKLGGITWASRRAKVKDRVLAMAHDLLRLHAMRAVVEGHAYEGRPELLQQFEESFPYVETPDQQQAIDDVLGDLAMQEPMDRLIVGDVGFGKTEVAMRAAVRVLLEGRQVAVLCPTTILVFQHDRTFRDRMSGLPVRVEALSRFRSASETKAVIADAATGRVDVVIGTTSILSRSLRFKDLGLVIVDEEHRFGCEAEGAPEEALPCRRVARHERDADPAHAPHGAHRPPQGERDHDAARRAPPGAHEGRAVHARADPRGHPARARTGRPGLLRAQPRAEHRGDGALRPAPRPDARVAVAHGQMDEKKLEEVLVRFIRREVDVLVSTTIIESGVDLPNVNTMIVSRADTLGLAQLYQLRGRVGGARCAATARSSCRRRVGSTGRRRAGCARSSRTPSSARGFRSRRWTSRSGAAGTSSARSSTARSRPSASTRTSSSSRRR